MAYQVLARKWRPRRFEQVVGQSAALRALSHALEQQRLHHAYLFTGTRGVGKTTLARIFAKCVNCEKGITQEPCGTCSACQDIDNGCFPDLIEVDAASRSKVEETRDLLDNVIYAPSRGRYKIYLIDEVHMLSGHSFNALLKTLEEPPAHVKFLLATTDPQRLPATIISRCLQFALTPLTPELISKQLEFIVAQENMTAEPEALNEIAHAARGSMRDALSLLDQLLAYAQGKLSAADVRMVLGIPLPEQVYQMLTSLAQRDASALIKHVSEFAQRIPDLTTVVVALIECLQQIALVQLVPNSVDPQYAYGEQVVELSKQFSPEDIQLFYDMALKGRRDLPYAATARSGLEMILLRMLAFFPESTKPESIKPVAAPVHKPEMKKTVEVAAEVKSAPVNTVATVAPANVAAAHVTPESTPVVKAKAPVLELTAENWNDITKYLPITEMTRVFAQHCIVIEAELNSVKLAVAPQHGVFLNKQQHLRIQDALKQYYEKPIALQIVVQDLHSITPAEKQKAVVEEGQQQALATLMADNGVQVLMSTFEATVVPNSVQLK